MKPKKYILAHVFEFRGRLSAELFTEVNLNNTLWYGIADKTKSIISDTIFFLTAAPDMYEDD